MQQHYEHPSVAGYYMVNVHTFCANGISTFSWEGTLSSVKLKPLLHSTVTLVRSLLK